MSSAWSQLEQMLTCAICLDKFKNPRLLPCQHSFCGDACMEGLVDYARRQIKCPECRAEHRIPYQGVQSLPSNVTLIRFLELHSRITGEEPEPVPTFMEKCSVCGEKVDGVQRCSHCEKKVCPECKEAHIDLLRREINRINGQSKRCLSKLQDFKETLTKAEERLTVNHKSVKGEIEESCRRLMDDLKAKQARLLEEVDSYVENEQGTLDKLKVAIVDELLVLESNSRLADERVANNKFQWTDQELWEMKEIYAKAMEFVRLFDPDIGDFNRKIRFNLIPEFEQMRRRICELGELKFGESADSLIASSFQYCNATGQLAIELSQKAAQAANTQASGGGYGLAPSNSNTNLHNQATSVSTLLELPGSMQNALMRSQSDHRLASQFQQRLKQHQQELASSKNSTNPYGSSSSSNRYGGSGAGAGGAAAGKSDYETDALRSRYAPPRASIGSAKDYANELLTRDWPRPSDHDSSDMPSSFGSSIHFKSAFMRRKEKERLAAGSYAGTDNNDDDDLTSEASYGGMSTGTGRNVRFYDHQAAGADSQSGPTARPRLFDCKEAEHAPMSGVPRLDECPHLLMRLHQMGAKAIVDKKQAEEDGKRDKDLIESARQAMSQASERSKLAQRQMSEDEIEKQKRANRQRDEQQQQQTTTTATGNEETIGSGTDTIRRGATTRSQQLQQDSASDQRRQSPSRAEQTPVSSVAPATAEPSPIEPLVTATTAPAPATPPSPATSIPGGRRSLYGQAVTEKSRRQLSSAIQDAVAYSLRRSNVASSSAEGEQTPDTSEMASNSSGGPTRTKRTLRSSGRSASKQSSVDQSADNNGSNTSSSTTGRRRRLARAESSASGSQQATGAQQSSTSIDSPAIDSQQQSKNYATGSGGHSDNSQASRQGSLMTDQTAGKQGATSSYQQQRRSGAGAAAAAEQTSTTTDDDADPVNLVDEEDNNSSRLKRPTSRASYSSTSRQRSRQQTKSDDSDDSDDDDDDDDDEDDDDDDGDGDSDDGAGAKYARGTRNKGNRRSREMLPNAVNKLLDRSAQIRRDSQEQRSRGDSPQRSLAGRSATATATATTTTAAAPTSQSSFYSARPSSSSSAAGFSSATRQRLAYQRSQSIRDDDDKTNSNNSIYTTASSAASGRRSSIEDSEPLSARRMSSHSASDRTLTSTTATATRPSAYRRDSSGDTSPSVAGGGGGGGGYQSRFLARSRTSAALSSSPASSLNRSQDQPGDETSDHHHHHPRSYLSSRDRFMQSTASSGDPPTTSSLSSYAASRAAAGSSSGAGTGTGAGSGASAASSYSASGPLGAVGLAAYSNRLATPFMDFEDDDDYEQYGAYLPSVGFRTHSEYLRNKFATRRSSSNSSGASSALLSRSKSSHAAFSAKHSDDSENDDDDDDDENDDQDDHDNGNNNNNSDASRRLAYLRSRASGSGGGGATGSRRSEDNSAASFDSIQSSPASRSSIYAGKRRLLFKLGSRGSQTGNFTWPRGVAVGYGARGGREIVVADSSNHRVQVFDSSGKFLNEFGSYGSAPGEFDCLAGIAINRLNKSYIVSDRYNHRIQMFDMVGKFVRSFGEHGKESGKFNLPWGVACDNSSGLIYVCDKENHRIQVFDGHDGSFVNKFGACGVQPGQLQHPHYISVGLGKVVVTDTNNHRVQVFDLSGRVLNSFGKEGSSNGQFKFPRGIAMDEQGNVIVGDSGNNRLQIFSSDGTFLKSIGTWGSADGEFKGIEGVAVDSSHNILVCDRENHRIQVF